MATVVEEGAGGICVSAERVVAIVLGGGRGTRLYPLTAERAKPAVPVGGRYRLVDIPLSNCIHSGINRIFVLTQFNSASLNRHLNRAYKFDTFSRGFVEILAAEQTMERSDWFQGTADAIRQHLRHVQAHTADFHLILSGDQLYRMDYRTLMATHSLSDADITVAVLPVTKAAAPGFGILKTQQDGRITEFVEKPAGEGQLTGWVTPAKVLAKFGVKSPDRKYLASMGVYLFKPRVLEELLQGNRDWQDFGKDVIPNAIKTHRVYAHVFPGFWEDIGTVRSYYEVSMQLTSPNAPFRFYDPDRPIFTGARHLPGSLVQEATISNSIICEGGRLSKTQISKSVIGIRSVVQPDTVIDRSVLMGADYFEERPERAAVPLGIGANSHISGAIIDKNARIGKNVVIRGDIGAPNVVHEDYCIVGGIVVVRRGATIPDGTQIG